jgi:hypothetical protein
MGNSSIFKNFILTSEEYAELCKKFQDLCRFAAWQLIRKNVRNNHTDEMEDIEQDLLIAVIRAGVYYKRQVYIEDCLSIAKHYAADSFLKEVVDELIHLWKNRTKHGANKQKFGEPQEKLLDRIVREIVPTKKRPDKKRSLIMDAKFTTYCKQIVWNQQKSLGRKITRERSIRNGLVSLSEFSYLSQGEA